MKLEYRPDGLNDPDKDKEQVQNALEQGLDMADQMKYQAEKMKDKPFKEKLSYFWEYYKMPVIGVIVGLIIVISIVKTLVSAKDYCFVAMLVNSSNIDTDVMESDFGKYAGLDLNKYECYINANESENIMSSNASDYGAATRFAALLSANDLDCVIYDSTVFNNKAVNDVFVDLTTVLGSEDIKRYEQDFYYVDREILKKVAEDLSFEDAYLSERGSLEDQKKDLEYHTNPEAMADPVPVGIVLTDTPMVKVTDSYYEMFPVFAITQNTQRLDTSIAFLHYITDDSIDFNPLRMF